MPIRIPDELPAVNVLRDENVFVMESSRASHQDIRPLKILILNLMPKKLRLRINFYACFLTRPCSWTFNF